MTNKIEFDAPLNTPPALVVRDSIGTTVGVRVDRIVRVNRSDPNRTPVVLTFDVRDPDVAQVLEGRIYVDYDRDTGTGPNPSGFTIAPNGTSVRSHAQPVPDSLLAAPGECHKVELLVAGRFDPRGDGRGPAEADDLAQVVFWVEVIDDAHPSADLSTCPN